MTDDSAHAGVNRGVRRALYAAIAITAALYIVPGGDVLARPLVWVSTLFHELGHSGVTALVGGDVDATRVFADGSGVAETRRPPGRLRAAAVAAGGLVGPAMGAALLFVLARRPSRARVGAAVLGAALLVAVVFALRGPIAVALGLLLGAGGVALGLRARPAWTQVAVLFLAVQLALSVFSRADYLFTPSAQTAAGVAPSDSAQIAAALAGPYWLWGALCGLLSLAVLAAGVRSAVLGRPKTKG